MSKKESSPSLADLLTAYVEGDEKIGALIDESEPSVVIDFLIQIQDEKLMYIDEGTARLIASFSRIDGTIDSILELLD